MAASSVMNGDGKSQADWTKSLEQLARNAELKFVVSTLLLGLRRSDVQASSQFLQEKCSGATDTYGAHIGRPRVTRCQGAGDTGRKRAEEQVCDQFILTTAGHLLGLVKNEGFLTRASRLDSERARLLACLVEVSNDALSSIDARDCRIPYG